ncbi:MAG: biotin-dependent carboxyltransferase family protein [Vicinamibacterales bacterium]
MLDILMPGLQTTVQDLGRWGYQASGVSVSGAMDPFAHRLANALVGNARHLATLEITLVGPTVAFSDARAFAVVGGDFDLWLDDQHVRMRTRLHAPAGSVLRFGERRHGARAYLAVEGGVDTPLTLGSRATHVTSALGGWQGRALKRGDQLPLGRVPRHTDGVHHPSLATFGDISGTEGVHVVRCLPGPHVDRFSADALAALTSDSYVIEAASDRMGYRLHGPALTHTESADIISDVTPVEFAAVCPGSQQPVLLMADRQTTGGYPQIATVITADLGVAAQAAPGDRLQFVCCTRAEAVDALHVRDAWLRDAEARWA